jgi:hypothetical protein
LDHLVDRDDMHEAAGAAEHERPRRPADVHIERRER